MVTIALQMAALEAGMGVGEALRQLVLICSSMKPRRVQTSGGKKVKMMAALNVSA
jgi:tagatose-1,6-bisphosphate aldolase